MHVTSEPATLVPPTHAVRPAETTRIRLGSFLVGFITALMVTGLPLALISR